MPLSARCWKQFAESRYADEREALDFLRESLPDRDPIFVYTKFEFIGDDGSVNEINALVVTQAGLIEKQRAFRGDSGWRAIAFCPAFPTNCGTASESETIAALLQN